MPDEERSDASLPLSATPELEDFHGKYESGRIGQKLVDGYFQAVERLLKSTQIRHEGQRAIEIGCGPGFSTMRIRRFLDGNVQLEASEYVDDQVEVARQNNPSLQVIQESVYALTDRKSVV